MRVTSYHTQPNGLCIETTEGILQLIAYTANIVRVRYAWELSPSAQDSLMIVAQPVSGIPYEVQETPHMLIFTPSAVEVQIQKETGAFVYRDRQGQVLTRENDLLASPAGIVKIDGRNPAPLSKVCSDCVYRAPT